MKAIFCGAMVGLMVLVFCRPGPAEGKNLPLSSGMNRFALSLYGQLTDNLFGYIKALGKKAAAEAISATRPASSRFWLKSSAEPGTSRSRQNSSRSLGIILSAFSRPASLRAILT